MNAPTNLLLAVSLALAVFATAGCSDDPETTPADIAPPPRVFDREEERRAVYSAHLRDNWTEVESSHKRNDPIVLVEATIADLLNFFVTSEDDARTIFSGRGEPIDSGAVNAFFATGDEVRSIVGPLDVPVDVEILPKDEIWELWYDGEPFRGEPSPRWQETFPNTRGFLELTDVGFAPNGRQAILCDAYFRDYELGYGTCYVLDWDDEDGWQTSLVIGIWVS